MVATPKSSIPFDSFLNLLRDERVEVRRAALLDFLDDDQALPEAAIDPLIDVLMETLRDDDHDVQRLATDALNTKFHTLPQRAVDLVGQRAMKRIVKCLCHQSPSVRLKVLIAFKDGPTLPQAACHRLIDVLVAKLRDDNDDVRMLAAHALTTRFDTIPQHAIDPLLQYAIDGLLNGVRDEHACSCLLALNTFQRHAYTLPQADNEPLIDVLIEKLRENDQNVRELAAYALIGNFDTIPESAIDPLLQYVNNGGPAARHLALGLASGLAHLENKLPEYAAQPFIQLLSSDRSNVRLAASWVLFNHFDRLPDFTADPLLRALDDNDSGVRTYAFAALAWHFRQLPESALTSPLKALRDADPGVRRAAAAVVAWSFENLPDYALPPLIEALRDSDPELRYSASIALGNLFPLASSQSTIDALGALLNALNDEDHRVRWNAAVCIATAFKILPASVIQLIFDLFLYSNPPASTPPPHDRSQDDRYLLAALLYSFGEHVSVTMPLVSEALSLAGHRLALRTFAAYSLSRCRPPKDARELFSYDALPHVLYDGEKDARWLPESFDRHQEVRNDYWQHAEDYARRFHIRNDDDPAEVKQKIVAAQGSIQLGLCHVVSRKLPLFDLPSLANVADYLSLLYNAIRGCAAYRMQREMTTLFKARKEHRYQDIEILPDGTPRSVKKRVRVHGSASAQFRDLASLSDFRPPLTDRRHQGQPLFKNPLHSQVEESILQQEFMDTVSATLETFDPDSKQIALQLLLGSLSVTEGAQRLGIPRTTLQSRYTQLKALLHRRFPQFGPPGSS